MTNLDDLLALLAIPAGPGEESPVAEHLRRTLIDLGVRPECIVQDEAHKQSEYGGKCGNLIVRFEGTQAEPRRLFSAHMDTVPLAVGAIARLDAANDRIVNDAAGRALGGDNRTGCAVLLQVARQLMSRRGQHGPVTLVFFVQEEVGLIGARGVDVRLLGEPKPSLGFNFDGHAADEIINAVIGAERFTINIAGVAAHAGAHPEDGVSAALIAARALEQLAREGWHGAIAKPEGKGSANAGIVRGGSGSNIVMPEMYILAEARSHDRAFRRVIIDRWQTAFSAAAGSVSNRFGATGAVAFGPGPCYEAFDLGPEAPVVQASRNAARRLGFEPRVVSNNGGMDANQLVAHGIPTVTLGAGQRHVHTPAEFIDLRQFHAACRLALELID